MQMLQQFQQFKKTMQGKDPQAVLNQMVQSGQVTEEQVKQATQMAKQFAQFLK